MITEKQLKDWLDENKRENLISEIERYIDKEIEKQVFAGARTIILSTGRPNYVMSRAEENKFYLLWCNSDISAESLRIVRNTIIKKYSELFDVTEEKFDEGWDQIFPGLTLKIKDKFLEGKK